MGASDGSGSEIDLPAGEVPIGYVASAHGLRGEVRARLFSETSSSIRRGVTLRAAPRGVTAATHTLVVVSAKQHGADVRMQIEGVVGRDAAEALVGYELRIARADLPPLGDDEVYLRDLIGLRAECDGQPAGSIEDVLHHPASDCARIRDAEGVREVPLAPPYLVEIDLRDGVVRFTLLSDFDRER